MSKNSRTSRKAHFCNTSQAERRCREREEKKYHYKEVDRLCELLTRVLDQLAVHDTEISHLERKLTLHSSSSDNIIRS